MLVHAYARLMKTRDDRISPGHNLGSSLLSFCLCIAFKDCMACGIHSLFRKCPPVTVRRALCVLCPRSLSRSETSAVV